MPQRRTVLIGVAAVTFAVVLWSNVDPGSGTDAAAGAVVRPTVTATIAATTDAAGAPPPPPPPPSEEYVHDDDLQIPMFNRPPTEVECLCGPENIPTIQPLNRPPRSCAPVFRNAIVHVEPGQRIRFHIYGPTMRHVRRVIGTFSNCIQWQKPGQQTFFWPTDSKFKLEMVNGEQDAAIACSEPGEPRPLHDSRRVSPSDVVNVTWHVARWFGLTPFHHTFDRGALQMFMQMAALKANLARMLGLPEGTPAESLPGNVFWTVSNVNDVEHVHTKRWMLGDKPNPMQQLYQLLSGIDRYDWHKRGFVCSPLQGLGYWYLSPMTYAINYTDTVGPTWPWIARATAQLRANLIARYGDTPVEQMRETEILWDRRPVVDYDVQQRARGIQPPLLNEIVTAMSSASVAHGGKELKLRSVRFTEDMPLQEQVHMLRAHRFVLTGEGAITVLATLARPNTTWIMVYNHTRPHGEWRHSTFHAGMARGLTNVRLFIYVIAHGKRAPAAELAEAAMAPFEPGVRYFGTDQNGQEAPPPLTEAPPASTVSPDGM